jgi:hypothetical protein
MSNGVAENSCATTKVQHKDTEEKKQLTTKGLCRQRYTGLKGD